MKYSKTDRQAINRLTDKMGLFIELERREQGDFVAVPDLCHSIESNPTLVIFSCLSGNGFKQELGLSLGTLFETRLKKMTEAFVGQLSEAGHNVPIMVLLDDCEPCRVWQWDTSQEEITEWCRMVIEDSSEEIPTDWNVKLWSDLERGAKLTFEESLAKMSEPGQALLVHQHLEHMRAFPNKKLIGDIKVAALRRVAGYALQGVVLEECMPAAILCQTETPWSIKDPIYNPFRGKPLPIIHPYPERR